MRFSLQNNTSYSNINVLYNSSQTSDLSLFSKRTEQYRYGFNGKESDPETVGTDEGTQDYGFRIYNPSLGKFLSVDPLTKSYPMLTPYQFASNRPIDGIDRDGLEYFNSTSIIYLSLSGCAGIGVGGALSIQVGMAYDMIGKTMFVQRVAMHPGNQDIEDGSLDPQLIFGAAVGADLGVQVVHRPTFSQAVNNTGGVDAPTEVDLKLKAGVGGGVNFGIGKHFQVGASVGYGVGASIKTGDQDDLVLSVSITSEENKKIKSGVFGISNSKLVVINNVAKYEANVVDYDANNNPKNTNIKVYSDAVLTKGEDGKMKYENNNVYKSESYSKLEKGYEE